jgi:hypothetical protein
MTTPGDLCSRISIRDRGKPHGDKTFRKFYEFVPYNIDDARCVIHEESGCNDAETHACCNASPCGCCASGARCGTRACSRGTCSEWKSDVPRVV